MRVKPELRMQIIEAYKAMATQLYKTNRDINSDKLRMMVAQTIVEHCFSKELEALQGAKRMTKHKIKKQILQKKIKEEGYTPEAKEYDFSTF